MILFIDRPFEVWPVLGDWHVERLYMLFCALAWLVAPGKRILPDRFHVAVAGMAVAVGVCWAMSPWAERTQPRVEDWFKILVFYGLLVTTISTERDLRFIVTAFVAVMGLYLVHSFREYLGGRHTYRMGIARMIGVDQALGDPNSFAASIVVALPIALSLWRPASAWGRWLLAGYGALSIVCILLTGSRSAFLALVLWVAWATLASRRRWLMIAAVAVAAPVAFFLLPESLQNRFETIVNPDVGPANARESGEGRIQGLFTGFELWARSPLTGVGPGAWRPATGSTIESHSLAGQLVGEMGLLGVLAFGGLLTGYALNLIAVRRLAPDRDDPVAAIARGIGMAIVLLLVLGLFGHNLFRFTWLWYGGFLVIARWVVMEREPEEERLGFSPRREAADQLERFVIEERVTVDGDDDIVDLRFANGQDRNLPHGAFSWSKFSTCSIEEGKLETCPTDEARR
jgi:hypothetical protein